MIVTSLLLFMSLVLNVVLLNQLHRIRSRPLEKKVKKSGPRRGTFVHDMIMPDKSKLTVRLFVEEVENLGKKSKIKYLEVAGIQEYYHDQVKHLIGTLIDQNKIDWLNDSPREEVPPHNESVEALNTLLAAAEKQLTDKKNRAS